MELVGYQKSNILLRYLGKYKSIRYIWSYININYSHLQMKTIYNALDTFEETWFKK